MTSAIELIGSAEMLTRIFGRWPSFHDAEVVRVVLDRSGPEGPTLDAEIHLYEMTSEVVLSELVIRATDPRAHAGRSIAVEMGCCFGVGASFVCKRCEVVSAAPWHTAS